MCENSQKNDTFCEIKKRLLRHLSSDNSITDLSYTFSALNSNSERVDFAIKVLKSYETKINLINDEKNDEMAIKMREIGNNFYKNKNMKAAWEHYTRSVACAEEKGPNLALAYANRSAVLFESKLHEECLMDIERALKHNYPEHLKNKLYLRQKKAQTGNLKHPSQALPIISAKNPKIQCASDCIEVHKNEELGRYILANRDIKAGEILVVEKPFMKLLVAEFFDHCHECLALCYNLIPCKNCTKALYCSDNCRDEAFISYHQYECPILATLHSFQFEKLILLTLRIAFCVSNYNITKMESDEVYRSDRYFEIHNLITNTEKRTSADLFHRAIGAAFIFNLVKAYTNFFKNFNFQSEVRFKEILLLHMQTGPSNFHEITGLVCNSSGFFEPREIASGAFAFLSLFNHSCAPNVTRFSYGSSVVMRAIENIQKGQQCLDNYGYHYAVTSKEERQKNLKSQYYFDCKCEACENNWPLYDDLPLFGDNINVDDVDFAKLASADVDTSKKIVGAALCKLGELQQRKPCQDFCKIQEIVKQCFAIFANKRVVF